MYKCKSPVLLIFFNRPDAFEKVFEKVREVQPENLILVQDGPRNEKDIANVRKCREIASHIDWDCNVICDFSETNLGCGMRPQTGITLALRRFDRVIILEDDCIPADSFFRYCDEMLEKYQDDNRISYVSGLNHFEIWDCGEQDYFFTKTGAIWGWATWANKWNRYYDYYVSGVKNPYVLKLVEQQFPYAEIAKSRKAGWLRAYESSKNGENLSYWDNQWGFVKYSQNMLVVTPKFNQIYNVGVGATSTHAQNQTKVIYKRFKSFFYIPPHQMQFPLKHPEYVVCDVEYDNLVYKAALGNPVRRKAALIVNKLLRKKKMSLSECIKEPLRPMVHKIKNVLKFKNRTGLTNRTFSVISNNCGGGFITQHFGVVYHSPTAGLFFHTEDYLRFVKNIRHYFEECRLEFIPPENSVHYGYLKETSMYGDYPVAKLDDIEIYFMHYKTEEEAASKWYRRAARVDYNNMLVLLFENETTTPELLSEFDGLAMPHYELVYNHYKGLKYALYNQNVANHEQHAWKPEWVIEAYDWEKELNRLGKYHGK